jgi:hypothetical protein
MATLEELNHKLGNYDSLECLQFMEKFKDEFSKIVKLSINPKTYGNDNDLLEKVVKTYKD